MMFTVAFRAASGPTAWDCHFVAERWDAELSWGYEQSDFWVGQVQGGKPRVLRSSQARLSGLWRSLAGHVYVAESHHWESVVHSTSSGEIWRSDVLDIALAGITGVDDRFVIAWGDGKNGQPAMRRFDGLVWSEMPAPGPVRALRAFDRDLFAVGENGLVARWEGSGWVTWKGRRGQSLRALARPSAGELYAGGVDGIGRSTPGAWEQVAEPDFDVEALAWFEGALWIGAREAGLFRASESALTRVRSADVELEPIGLEGAERLLIVSESSLADTEDGASFRKLSTASVLPLVADAAPLWR
jgi:hypothetical protein